MNGKSFIDTNLWIYLFTDSEFAEDQNKRSTVVALLRDCTEIVIPAQVLSELANVFLKKMAFPIEKIQRILNEIIATV